MKNFILVCLFLSPFIVPAQVSSSYDELIQLYNDAKYEEIINRETVLVSWVKDRTDTIAADVFSYLGLTHINLDSVDKAIYYFEKEKVLRQALLPASPAGYSNVLYNMTDAFFRAGNYEKAKQSGELLIAFDAKINGLASEVYISSLIAYLDILSAIGEVVAVEQKIENVMKQIPEFTKENGILLGKLAEACSYNGKYRKAERLYVDALEFLRISEGEDSEIYIITLSNYASLLMNQGKYDQAEELLDQVLTATAGKDATASDTYYATLNNMALVKHRLGQNRESEQSYRKLMAVDSVAIGINHPDFSVTLSNMGILYTDEKRFVEAEQVLKRSLKILEFNKMTNSIFYAKRLNNLARVYQGMGKLNEAVSLLLQALKIYEKQFGKQSAEYAFPLFNLGTVYLYQKSPKALAALKEALDIRAKTLGVNHPLYAECEERIAQYYWMKKNKAETGKLYKNVFDNYYGQIDSYFPVLTEEEKSNFFFQKVKPSVETFASFAIQSNDKPILGQMFDYHVNTKGLILQATEKVRKSILSSGDSSPHRQ